MEERRTGLRSTVCRTHHIEMKKKKTKKTKYARRLKCIHRFGSVCDCLMQIVHLENIIISLDTATK